MRYRESLNRRSVLFDLGLFIYVLAANLQASYSYNHWAASGSFMVTALRLMRYLAYLLLAVRIAADLNRSRREMLIGIAFFAVSFLAAIKGTDKTPVFYALIFLAAMGEDFHRVVRLFLATELSCFIIFVGMALLGANGGLAFYVENGNIRYFLGYGWVNRAAYAWLFITLNYLYLKGFRLSLPAGLGLMAVDVAVYLLTSTDFPYFITVLLILLGGMLGYADKRRLSVKLPPGRRFAANVVYAAAALFVLVMVMAPFLYRNPSGLMRTLDGFINHRFSLASAAIDRYPLGLFGHRIDWVGSSTLLFGLGKSTAYFYVDSDYLKMSLEYGLLYTGAVVLSYVLGVRYARINRDRAGAICLVAVLLLSTLEPELIDMTFSPFALYCFTFLKRPALSGRRRSLPEKKKGLIYEGV